MSRHDSDAALQYVHLRQVGLLGSLDPMYGGYAVQVVLFDPMYDSYVPMCTVAGASVRVVRLDERDWRVPRQELAAAFSSRTKLVVVYHPLPPSRRPPRDNPHNADPET